MSAIVYKKSVPAMFDFIIEEVEQALADGVAWLDRCYGKAERILVVAPSGKKETRPAWPLGGLEYEYLMPDDIAGCYSFFVLEDPVRLEDGVSRADFHLIVWGDMTKVGVERNTEYARQQILDALGAVSSRYGHFDVRTVSEGPDNVFRGFSLDETANQSLVQPWFGFRFSGEMVFRKLC